MREVFVSMMFRPIHPCAGTDGQSDSKKKVKFNCTPSQTSSSMVATYQRRIVASRKIANLVYPAIACSRHDT
jgi:hypothetical protein